MLTTFNGHQVFYATGGQALDVNLPALVFVHGAGMDHTVWTLQSRYFARHGHAVIALDLPGHGRSLGAPLATVEALATWVLGVVRALGFNRAVLIGHSLGSLVVLEAAGQAPQFVRSLALLGFSYPMQVGAPLLEAAQNNDHAAVDMLMIWGHDYVAQLGGNAVPGMGIVTPIQRLVERAAPGVLYTDLHACHVYAGGIDAAPRVQCPVTLILGDRDRMTPLKGARAFMQHFKQPHLTLLQTCGHGMLEERPEETYRALAAVLDQV